MKKSIVKNSDITPAEKVDFVVNRVMYQITTIRIISKRRILILIDDEFARAEGFRDRTEMLKKRENLCYADLELWLDPLSRCTQAMFPPIITAQKPATISKKPTLEESELKMTILN